MRIAAGLRTLTLSTMRAYAGQALGDEVRQAGERAGRDAPALRGRVDGTRGAGRRAARRDAGARAAMEDEEPDRLVALEDRDRLLVRVGLGGGQRLGQAARETLLVRPRREAQEPVAQIRAHRRQSDVHGPAG